MAELKDVARTRNLKELRVDNPHANNLIPS
jgi:hypothetical protein